MITCIFMEEIRELFYPVLYLLTNKIINYIFIYFQKILFIKNDTAFLVVFCETYKIFLIIKLKLIFENHNFVIILLVMKFKNLLIRFHSL